MKGFWLLGSLKTSSSFSYTSLTWLVPPLLVPPLIVGPPVTRGYLYNRLLSETNGHVQVAGGVREWLGTCECACHLTSRTGHTIVTTLVSFIDIVDSFIGCSSIGRASIGCADIASIACSAVHHTSSRSGSLSVRAAARARETARNCRSIQGSLELLGVQDCVVAISVALVNLAVHASFIVANFLLSWKAVEKGSLVSLNIIQTSDFRVVRVAS